MEKCEAAANKLIPPSYVVQGIGALRTHDKALKHLIEQRRLPEIGWSELNIERCVSEIAAMDTNNFTGNIGGGEREGRVYSSLVSRRHYHLSHGMGRSGDIAANQPKAAGSAIMCRVTEGLMLDILKECGCKATKSCVILPVATGMAMLLCILYLKGKRPQSRIVIWPRIDQKTCIKAPQTAGCVLVVVEPLFDGDSLVTDVDRVKELLELYKQDVTCVLSTTSCFAPRTPDKLVALSELCANYDVPHVVNNAYGIQSTRCMGLLNTAATKGRVDLFVQSLDKNFMVPVGGSVVAGFTSDSVAGVSQTYPGRGSSTPVLDLFITVLSMGRQGLRGLLADRVKVFDHLKLKLSELAVTYDERVLQTPHNQISLAFTLGNFGKDNLQLTEIGSKLFQRNVTGARVVTPGNTKTIGSCTFTNFGSHSNDYPVPYITFAAAVGMTIKDVDVLVEKLDKVLYKLYKIEK